MCIYYFMWYYYNVTVWICLTEAFIFDENNKGAISLKNRNSWISWATSFKKKGLRGQQKQFKNGSNANLLSFPLNYTKAS